MPTYHGSCHCGAVRFEIETELSRLVRCDCSLCHKRNAVMAMVHESNLRITAGQDSLALYRWNTGTAQHFFCKICGIYPFHRRRTAPDHYAVNAFCLDDADLSGVPVELTEGRSLSSVTGEA